MLRADKEYQDFKVKADAGVSFLDAKIKERESIDEIVEFELVKIRQIIDNPINIAWTIKNVIERGGVNLISGAYGSGKSFLAYSMAFCVSAGIDWYGHKTGQCPVIILAGEGHSGIGDRFNALSIHHEIDCPDDLYLSKSPARISDRTNALWVKKAVDAICPDSGFIIIDTLNRNFGDGDENSTKDMTAFITSIDDHFRSTGKTILIVHHTGHAEAGRARGSSVLPGSCEGEFIVSNSDGIVKFTCKKQKNSKRPDDFEFSFKEIFLNRYDEDYEPVFSLVLEHDGSQDSDAKTLGKNDIIFLNTMKEYALGFGVTMPKYLFLDDQENYPNVTVLEERNFKKVTFENFKCSPGSAKMTYKRCKEKLVRLGFINEIGGYIYPLKSHA